MRGIYIALLAGLLFFAGCVGQQNTTTPTQPSVEQQPQTPATGGEEQQPSAPQVQFNTVGDAIKAGKTVVCTTNISAQEGDNIYEVTTNEYYTLDKYALELVDAIGDVSYNDTNITLPAVILVSVKDGEQYRIYIRTNQPINGEWCDWAMSVSTQPAKTYTEVEDFPLNEPEQQELVTPAGAIQRAFHVCKIYEGSKDPFQVEGKICEYNLYGGS